MAATNVTHDYTVPCILSNNETCSWIRTKFTVKVEPVQNDKQYKISIWAHIYADYDMAWNGDSWINITCNNKVVADKKEISFPLYGSGQNNSSGPWVVYFPTSAISNIHFSLEVDMTRTQGDYGGLGPSYVNRPGVNFQYFRTTQDIDVTTIPLITKPTLGKLINSNKYIHPVNGAQDLISADETSISISWQKTAGDAPDWCKYRINGGDWTNTSDKYKQTISNLQPGSSYKIEIYGHNGAGDSNTISITIRTRYSPPNLGLSLKSVDLETLTFNWSSDKELKSTFYKIDNGSFVELKQTGTSGTFTAKWFNPKTTHTIYFYGISTDVLDSLTGDTKNASGTTYDKAHIKNIDRLIFGLSITFSINSESAKKMKLKIWGVGKTRQTSDFIYDNLVKNGNDFTYTWTPTQNELDDLYKCFTDLNTIDIKFLLTTHGDNKDWDDIQQNKILTLTGIAKTSHIGIDNKPRRTQCWIGDKDGKPRRAVAWVGDKDGKARRCI